MREAGCLKKQPLETKKLFLYKSKHKNKKHENANCVHRSTVDECPLEQKDLMGS